MFKFTILFLGEGRKPGEGLTTSSILTAYSLDSTHKYTYRVFPAAFAFPAADAAIGLEPTADHATDPWRSCHPPS
jgi:hypothetical protein